MQSTTPEGTLEISDDTLTFTPNDDGPTLTVKLTPMPDHFYQRGLYELGTLSIGPEVIILKNDQVAEVIEELKRPRGKLRKSSETPAK